MSTVIDGTNAVLGRLAATVAERLQKGEEITIINAEKVIITGNPNMVKKKWLQKYETGDPHHGPWWPKRPDLMLHRSIRGMMAYKKKTGRDALKKLKVFMGTAGIDAAKTEKMTREIKTNFITLGELATVVGGWKAEQ